MKEKTPKTKRSAIKFRRTAMHSGMFKKILKIKKKINNNNNILELTLNSEKQNKSGTYT